MAFNFPSSPTEGQLFTPAGGATYIYHAPAWELASATGTRPPINVKDFGAIGNGVANDAPAFQAACDSLPDGGRVYVPTSVGGSYKLTSQVYLRYRGIEIIGDSIFQPIIVQTTLGQHGFVMQGGYNSIRRLQIALPETVDPSNTGFGILCDGEPFTNADLIIDQCLITGGFGGIWMKDSADVLTMRCKIYNCYGYALILGGGYIWRCKLDPNYPGATPTAANMKGGWAPFTVYSLNDMITMVQGGITWWLQCTSAGTSGGTQPTIVKFGQQIVDNTARWYLALRGGLAAIRYENMGYSAISFCDMEGALQFGVRCQDASQQLQLGPSNNIGRVLEAAVRLSDAEAYGYHIHQNTMFGVVQGTVITINSNASYLRIIENSISGSAGHGIFVASGRDIQVIGNVMGVEVDYKNIIFSDGVLDFNCSNNTCNSGGVGIVTGGTSDYYQIVGNNVHRCAIPLTDNALGTNKLIAGNV